MNNAEDDRSLDVISSVLSETRTVLSVAAVIFGFLLNMSANPEAYDSGEQMLLLLALFSGILAVGILSIPVIYHHLSYPYRNPQRFETRFHFFMSVGLVPFALMFIFSTAFALHRLIGFNAYYLTGLAVLIVVATYVLRRKFGE